MNTNTPRNAELLAVPNPALRNIFPGSFHTLFRRNSSIGMTCSAPYIGSIHRTTLKKRSIWTCGHESSQGCNAEHGTNGGPKDWEGGCAVASAIRASMSERLAGVVSCWDCP